MEMIMIYHCRLLGEGTYIFFVGDHHIVIESYNDGIIEQNGLYISLSDEMTATMSVMCSREVYRMAVCYHQLFRQLCTSVCI